MVAAFELFRPAFLPESPRVYPEIGLIEAQFAFWKDVAESRNELERFNQAMKKREKEREDNPVATIGNGRGIVIAPGRTLEREFYYPVANALVADGFKPIILSGGEGLNRVSFDEGRKRIRNGVSYIKQETGMKAIILSHSKSVWIAMDDMKEDDSGFYKENVESVVFMGGHPEARVDPNLIAASQPLLSLSADRDLIERMMKIETVPKIEGVTMSFFVSPRDPIVRMPNGWIPGENEYLVDSSHHGMLFGHAYDMTIQSLTPESLLHKAA